MYWPRKVKNSAGSLTLDKAWPITKAPVLYLLPILQDDKGWPLFLSQPGFPVLTHTIWGWGGSPTGFCRREKVPIFQEAQQMVPQVTGAQPRGKWASWLSEASDGSPHKYGAGTHPANVPDAAKWGFPEKTWGPKLWVGNGAVSFASHIHLTHHNDCPGQWWVISLTISRLPLGHLSHSLHPWGRPDLSHWVTFPFLTQFLQTWSTEQSLKFYSTVVKLLLG